MAIHCAWPKENQEWGRIGSRTSWQRKQLCLNCLRDIVLATHPEF